jgi:hypothetical protein
MAADLSNKDHDLLDDFLVAVLDRYKTGKTDLASARADLAEAFALVARADLNVLQFMQSVIDGKGE